MDSLFNPSRGSSLSARLKLLTGLWLIAALAAISFTLALAWRLEGAGAAINETGRLRTHVYRLAYLVKQQPNSNAVKMETAAFEQSMHNIAEGDPKRPLFLPNDPDVHDKMQLIMQFWYDTMKPMLLNGPTPAQEQLQQFADILNNFAYTLENVNAHNIDWLRRFQMALLVMIVTSAAIMMILLYSWVIRPINLLRNGVQAIRRGEFGAQVETDTAAEFAQLAQGFNRMSSHLKTLYTDLEKQVSQKTQSLANKNRELETLYETTRNLHRSRSTSEAASDFLQHIIQETGAKAGDIKLYDTHQKRLDLVAEQNIDQLPQQETPNQAEFPIKFKQEKLGILSLYFSDGLTLQPHDNELIYTLCNQLGVSVINSRLIEESRQLAVLQERNLMAQGLHDSIAQTLSFLNLQAQMLESAMQAGEPEQAEENIRFIKSGVQECYDDVRELLLNFRTKISNKDFPEAVHALADRFEQQTHMPVSVTMQGNGLPLNPDEQLQVIFIIQESLSNIRKHARASNVSIAINNNDDFTLTISDNGLGFDDDTLDRLSPDHVGLGIMHERARRISAELQVQSQPQSGTQVKLTLPQNKRTVI